MYGSDKQRTMLRSLLPSSSRKKAREDKKLAHKVERAKTRQALHEIVDLESAEECESDLYHSSDHEMREIVRERRNADKTAPFERWIKANTDHLEDPHDKWDYAKSLLPANLIGDHALTHLPYEWDPDTFKYGYRQYRVYGTKAEREAKKQAEYLALYEALYQACVRPGLHKILNNVLKDHFSRSVTRWNYTTKRSEWEICGCTRCRGGVRLLRGIGDIEAFIVDWHKWSTNPSRNLLSHGSSWKEMIALLRYQGLL